MLYYLVFSMLWWTRRLSIAEKLLEELREREDLRDALAEELALSLVKNRRG